MKTKSCFYFKQLRLCQCKIYWFPVLSRLRNVLSWLTEFKSRVSSTQQSRDAGASQVSADPVSLTCALAAWEHSDLQQWVCSEILAVLDVTQGLQRASLHLICLLEVSQVMEMRSAKYDGWNGRGFRLVHTALPCAWFVRDAGGDCLGPGKAVLNLCSSKVHAWMWFWIPSRFLGLLLFDQLRAVRRWKHLRRVAASCWSPRLI